ncbi:ABC transporter substrate-binding protein [Rhodomicrobium sp. Az07]|uniref:ABC transporter substrate-binding protein n=1 Tax=Rhodomicrobium sp. Az07 TaxID=2839034 RepID=UPI001BE60FE9|nr:ABC transporter substrate-binding protein [Rhodomicrobium sp. Az07]MBT3071104.1 ABC transporter substrate-binding protein [Rhodomicrobium sp. Az07]
MKLKLLMVAASALLATCSVANAEISVKIGVLTDKSGTYSDLAGQGSVVAAELAIEDFKKIGQGVKADVISADHQNKGDIASNIARQWYDTEGVDMVADLVTSTTALAVSEITREKNKIAMVSGAASSDLTGPKCNANTLHWTYDTWQLANGTGSSLVKTGGDTWFFLTADYAFGHALERDTGAAVKAANGKVLGSVRHPFPAQDFSSFLLQAQGSGAKVIGLANAGSDTINSIKQASEFGITQAGQNLAGLLVFLSDVHALGLNTAQGLVVTTSFYWDTNDETRAWSKRFGERMGGKMPTMVHAGVYSSVLHYLKAVAELKDKDTAKVVAKMKEMPTDDPVFGKGTLRADGRKIHPSYLVQVKKPEESKGPYDYYKILATTPAEQAFRPLKDGGCPLVKTN